MGNILGKPRVFYLAYDYEYYPSSSSSEWYYYGDEYAGDEQSYEPYGWADLCCYPWFEGASAEEEDEEEETSWGGAVVGIVRRKGCTTPDHWALAFRSDIDVTQLPRRINGFRTRIPSRCKRTCSYWQPVFIFAEGSSSDDSSLEATDFVVAD
ncbi:hypothetical protein F4781DRAFT_434358 [Annulohypoxylon bovei var. microspora]|nr:hypothetical protein F4781DRAFT_434358 [Annulohypoxylon bovei var. microspora]